MSQPSAPAPALARALVEIAAHVDDGRWDHPPRLYALAPTALVARHEPGAAALLDEAPLTPIEQEALPTGVAARSPELAEYVATLRWPPAVVGCLLAQDLVVVAPDAAETAPNAAGRPARLLTGVLDPSCPQARGGASEIAVLQLRGIGTAAEPGLRTAAGMGAEELAALRHTLRRSPDDSAAEG